MVALWARLYMLYVSLHMPTTSQHHHDKSWKVPLYALALAITDFDRVSPARYLEGPT